jgi:hypothetical protein
VSGGNEKCCRNKKEVEGPHALSRMQCEPVPSMFARLLCQFIRVDQPPLQTASEASERRAEGAGLDGKCARRAIIPAITIRAFGLDRGRFACKN